MGDRSVYVQVLGPLAVSVSGATVPVTGPCTMALLSLLCLHRRAQVRADRIPDMLVTTPDGYCLQVPEGSVDVDRFEHLVADGRRQREAGDHDAAASSLRAAERLWVGPPLAELPDDMTARAEATRLAGLRHAAARDRLGSELALGRHHEAVAELRAWVEADSLDEEWTALLMPALYRSGRQADALAACRDLRDRLRDDLGVSPGPALERRHRAILEHDHRVGDPDPYPRRDRTSAVPAPVTSFVGRVTELAHLEAMLASNRLVTLTGPGGSGKTRLALEMARRIVTDEDERDAVLVELAPLDRDDSVLGAIAVGLGVVTAPMPGTAREPRTRAERVAEAVRGWRLLLVVDNCEHVIDGAAAAVETVLGAGADVTVVATSREALRVPGEAVCPVPPLGLPADDVRDVDTLVRAPAVALFVDRARSRGPRLPTGRLHDWACHRTVPPPRRPPAGHRAGGRADGLDPGRDPCRAPG